MADSVVLSQVHWMIISVGIILLICSFQYSKLQKSVAKRRHDGWHAFPESDRVKDYRAESDTEQFIIDIADHFPGKFSDEDRQWMRLFLEGLPGDMTVFLRLAPVRIHSESRGVESDSALPPLHDFWIRSLASEGLMACYESVFTIPPVHQPDSQRLVFARPEEDGRDDTILAFVPKYVMR